MRSINQKELKNYTCVACEVNKDERIMNKVLLWEMGEHFFQIVIWDGKNTYWTEEMHPSGGYEDLHYEKSCSVTNSVFHYIGELE